jgi:hypothetical protein
MAERRPRTDHYDEPEESQRNLGRMASFTVEFRNVYSKLDDISSQITDLRTAFITRVEFDYLKTRVTELEGSQKWVYRLVIGALVVAGIELIIRSGVVK